jgi:hypothetical protein
MNTPFIQVLKSSLKESYRLQGALFVGGAIALAPLLVFSGSLFPDFSHKGFVAFCVAASITFGVPLLSLAVVPARIETLRDRLIVVTSGRRRISRELVALVIGDEAAAALNSVYLMQWLGSRTASLLLVVTITVGILAMALPSIFRGAGVEQFGIALMACCASLAVLYFVLAVCAYGLVQGLIALDSSVTLSSAPIGGADIATFGWTGKDKLRHSLIYRSPEAITRIVTWLKPILISGPSDLPYGSFSKLVYPLARRPA